MSMTARLRGTWLVLLLLPLGACGGGEPAVTSETPLAPIDSVPPPTDPPDPAPPLVPDTVVPPVAPPPDSGVSPTSPDTAAPPPDSTPVAPPPPPPTYPAPEHVGIPFGAYHVPSALYGPDHSTLLAAHPLYILADLEAARRTGGRVMLSLVGAERRIRDSDGHFSVAVWKQRVDRYRGIDFTSYIEDGTIIGHYVMDEPHDPNNWNGRLVSRSEIDEIARYSKQLWPAMPTIIRGWPDYLKGYQYKYLDAAWAQYSDRFGDIGAFISSNVRDARSAGLELVVGLNLLGGGNRSSGLKGYSGERYAMNASQVKSWGSALLAEPYVCAFISWKYSERYYTRADMKPVMADLNEKARSRPKKSCRK